MSFNYAHDVGIVCRNRHGNGHHHVQVHRILWVSEAEEFFEETIEIFSASEGKNNSAPGVKREEHICQRSELLASHELSISLLNKLKAR